MIGLPTNRAPTHPGEMLNEEFLKPLAIKQKDAADDLRISFGATKRDHQGQAPCHA
jgi:plasmid maintenance system antidote protein VapI